MYVARSAVGAVCTSMEADPESYIPVHPNEFQAALEHSLDTDQEAVEFLRLRKASLASLIHSRLYGRYKGLLEGYTFLDPDREAADGRLAETIASSVSVREIVDSAQELLLDANYYRLTPSQI